MELPSGRRSFMVSSDLAAETGSPVRSADLHHPGLDAENLVSAMELKRIPHGITSKHENRKSLSPKRSHNMATPRMPLTCSRADVVNLPNSVPPPIFTLEKGSSKRASSDFENSESKRMHNDDSLFDEDFMAEEAFSPIRLGVKEQTTMQTPSRPTESVAVSPPSDQHSRVIDETMSEATNKESPLKNVSTIAAKEFVNEGEEEQEQELDEILNSRANISVEDALRMSQEEERDEEEAEKTSKINYDRLPSPNELWESIKDVEDIESDNQTIVGESMISKAAVDKMTSEYLEQIGLLEETSTKTSRELHEAYAQIENLTAEVQSLEKQKHELRDRSSGLAVEIGVLEGKIATLDTKYRAENRSNTSRGKKIETYKVRYQQIFSAYKETNDVYNHTLERLDQAEHERAELKSRVAELETDNTLLKQQLAETTAAQSELAESKSAVEAELVGSKDQITQINAEVSELKSQLEQSSADLSAKQLELAQQLDVNEKLKEEISSKTSSFENEHDLYQRQEAELAAYKTELKGLESALAERVSSARVLEEQIAQLNAAMQEKEHESTQKMVELQEQLTSQISALEHDKHALEKSIEQQQTDIKAHLADIKELEVSNSELRKSLAQAADDKKSAEETIESLSLEIKNLKGVLSEQASSITSLNATIQTLEKQVSEHEAELESSLEALAQDLYVQYSEKHEKKVEILRKGYESKWTSRLNKSEKEREALQEVVDSLTKQLATEKAEKASLMKLYEACMEQR